MLTQQLPIQVAVAALATTAIAIFLSTWSRSPLYLPLPRSPFTPWLRSIPVLATVVIVGVLTTWFMDCVYLPHVTTVAVAAFVMCVALILVQIQDTSRRSKTLLVLMCYGWSIFGTLCVAATATMLVAKAAMDAAYKAHPLTLWRLTEGRKEQPSGPIYLTAKLPAHFRAELNECHEDLAPLTIKPVLGQLEDGTYTAPDNVDRERQVVLTAYSRHYRDKISATIILLPDSPQVTRKTYETADEDGRKATLDVIIISNTNSWVYESDTEIESNRLHTSSTSSADKAPTPVCRAILSLARSHAFEPYVDIVAVGTASREGRQAEEDDRAARRGENIARWVNFALQSTRQRKNVHLLNLGQYRKVIGEADQPTSDGTSHERPVVMLGVVRGGDIDLAAALDDVMRRNPSDPFFEFLSSHYPRRDIRRFAQVPDHPCE